MSKFLIGFFLTLSACTLTISPARASSLPGQVFALTASQSPVTWTATVGTITSTGLWTAPPCSTTLPITAVITAVSGNNSTTSQIAVEDRVTSVSITPIAATIAPNGTIQFQATIKTVCFPAGVVADNKLTLPASAKLKVVSK